MLWGLFGKKKKRKSVRQLCNCLFKKEYIEYRVPKSKLVALGMNMIIGHTSRLRETQIRCVKCNCVVRLDTYAFNEDTDSWEEGEFDLARGSNYTSVPMVLYMSEDYYSKRSTIYKEENYGCYIDQWNTKEWNKEEN